MKIETYLIVGGACVVLVVAGGVAYVFVGGFGEVVDKVRAFIKRQGPLLGGEGGTGVTEQGTDPINVFVPKGSVLDSIGSIFLPYHIFRWVMGKTMDLAIKIAPSDPRYKGGLGQDKAPEPEVQGSDDAPGL